ncbi:MAG: penicillin-binding transpeptidase domain-containing protein [Pseudomonadota bacterium]
MNGHSSISGQQARRLFLIAGMLLVMLTLVGRAISLQVLDKDFLKYQGQARHVRVVDLPAHRGMIRNRDGEPLAVSTPVESVWVNPQELVDVQEGISDLAQLLSLDRDHVQQLVSRHPEREFVYVRRHISPPLAEQVKQLAIPGVYLQKEYKRFYPGGEVTAHVVGFTDIDDIGQEGLELAFDEWLRGEPGAKRVIKDGQRHTIQDVESIKRPRPGKDLVLSIDRRIQYLAYRELKAAMQEHKAKSASAVVLDVTTGEVLAMVNQPSYNPNSRNRLRRDRMRNRAATDVFEPGSTMKPFIVAAALQDGRYLPETPINTGPGWFRVGRNTVKDVHNYGLLDVTGVIRKSSNVGITKIALSLPGENIWSLLSGLGFGVPTASGFPGESSGLLVGYRNWNEIETATLAFGYGISVTPLQLAQAYAVLASGGVRRPVTFLRQDAAPAGERVMSGKTASEVNRMLETVTGPQGTALQARVAGYRVGGKTGTVRKSIAGGYADDKYLAVFTGMAPVSDPRLVMVVMVNEPDNGKYYGGQVAAPVFSKVMSGALRLLAIPPDNLPLLETRRVDAGDSA